MKTNYKAKIIIKDLSTMTEVQLRDVIIWIEEKTKELRDVYKKPLPTKDYSKVYTMTLMKP